MPIAYLSITISKYKRGGGNLYINKMSSLREAREALILSYEMNLITDKDFLLLYEQNTSSNPDFPYWNYEIFDLDRLTDDECKASFRFLKNDLYMLAEALQIPERIICPNRLVVPGIEAFCIFLKRFPYPNWLGDMGPTIGRPVPQLSMIVSEMSNFLYENYAWKLTTFQQNWLSPVRLIVC